MALKKAPVKRAPRRKKVSKSVRDGSGRLISLVFPAAALALAFRNMQSLPDMIDERRET